MSSPGHDNNNNNNDDDNNNNNNNEEYMKVYLFVWTWHILPNLWPHAWPKTWCYNNAWQQLTCQVNALHTQQL